MRDAKIPQNLPKHLKEKIRERIKNGDKTVVINSRTLVKEIAEMMDIPSSVAMLFTNTVFLAMQNMLVRIAAENNSINTEISIPNFGKFNFILIPEHDKLVNHLEKTYRIPARYNLKFSPNRKWLESLNKKAKEVKK